MKRIARVQTINTALYQKIPQRRASLEQKEQ